MSTTLAQRIVSRLNALGKNPSSVALEAGLGRSSVRDIIVNGANPRIDTLQKLTRPLECSLEYLTGASAEPGLYSPEISGPVTPPIHLIESAIWLESGVFRPGSGSSAKVSTDIEPQFVFGHARYPGWSPIGGYVADDSLAGEGILQGDIVTAISDKTAPMPLTKGTLVIAVFVNNPALLVEASVRRVNIENGQICLTNLVSRSAFERLEVTEASELGQAIEDGFIDKFGYGQMITVSAGYVYIVGLVVRSHRTLKFV